MRSLCSELISAKPIQIPPRSHFSTFGLQPFKPETPFALLSIVLLVLITEPIMFRRLSTNLPKDPIIEADLDKLGYFVNGNDQMRQKANPDVKYQYKINRNERINDMHKEAMNCECEF